MHFFEHWGAVQCNSRLDSGQPDDVNLSLRKVLMTLGICDRHGHLQQIEKVLKHYTKRVLFLCLLFILFASSDGTELT